MTGKENLRHVLAAAAKILRTNPDEYIGLFYDPPSDQFHVINLRSPVACASVFESKSLVLCAIVPREYVDLEVRTDAMPELFGRLYNTLTSNLPDPWATNLTEDTQTIIDELTEKEQ